MLGQRYTTPMITVVCPVTKLHHMASLQSASSCNCTSYAGIVSLMYSNVIPLLSIYFHIYILSFRSFCTKLRGSRPTYSILDNTIHMEIVPRTPLTKCYFI